MLLRKSHCPNPHSPVQLLRLSRLAAWTVAEHREDKRGSPPKVNISQITVWFPPGERPLWHGKQEGKLFLQLGLGKNNWSGWNRIVVHLHVVELLSNCLCTQSLTQANISSSQHMQKQCENRVCYYKDSTHFPVQKHSGCSDFKD